MCQDWGTMSMCLNKGKWVRDSPMKGVTEWATSTKRRALRRATSTTRAKLSPLKRNSLSNKTATSNPPNMKASSTSTQTTPSPKRKTINRLYPTRADPSSTVPRKNSTWAKTKSTKWTSSLKSWLTSKCSKAPTDPKLFMILYKHPQSYVFLNSKTTNITTYQTATYFRGLKADEGAVLSALADSPESFFEIGVYSSCLCNFSCSFCSYSCM